MTKCEGLETRGPADEWGQVCNRQSNGWCYDCGIAICDQHTVACRTCHSRFCAACVMFHLEEHFKLAQPTQRHGVRKSA
jgi:hypothetical protein